MLCIYRLHPALRNVQSLISQSAIRCCSTRKDVPELSNNPSSSSLQSKTSILPQPSSPHHSSLASFIAHTKETGLSTSSTIYVGTYYEYLCALTLRRFGFTLTRTGGRSDAGIDLRGSWQLPELSQPLQCIVQCKKLKAKAGPNLVRELEGAFVGAPARWRGEGVVGVLCAGREATKGVRDAIRSARKALVWCQVQDMGDGVGRVRQLLWNQRVSALGAEGVGVGIRYSSQDSLNEAADLDAELVLTWKGEVWTPEVIRDGDAQSVSDTS